MARSECAVPLCNSVRGKSKGLSFHEFPADLGLRALWLNNICRQASSNSARTWIPDDRSVVCELHFDPSAYVEGHQRKRLKKYAIPTKFKDFPTHLKSRICPNELKFKRKGPASRSEPASKTLKKDEQLSIFTAEEPLINQVRHSEAIVAAFSPVKSSSFSSIRTFKDRPIYSKKCASPRKIKKKLQNNSIHLFRLRERNKKLSDENRKMKDQIQELTNRSNVILRIQDDAEKGVRRSAILLEQLNSYGKKRQKWSDLMLRHCVIWRSKSTNAYEYARKSGILKLPCATTLKKYLGPMSMEAGMPDIILERLIEQLKLLSPIETYSSLIFDEMAIKPMSIYVKQRGQIFGEVNYGKYRRLLKQKSGVLANRLLCFVMKGLSTNYTIPVAYFFVRKLKSETLVVLIQEVLAALEDIGYRIIRLVADDYSVNQKTFRILSGGELALPKIPNPANPERPLFLCFDYCHIMKNIRNNFLNRKLQFNGKPIDSQLILKLRELQKSCTLKPVRILSRKTLEPTNFEKMKVSTAIKLFGGDVIAALELMKSSGHEDFAEVETTVEFMRMMKKWWEINDVCSVSTHTRFRNKDKTSFWKLDDMRLNWLDEEFIPYLNSWKASCKPGKSKLKVTVTKKNKNELSAMDKIKKVKPTSYLTRDTDAAIRLTTQSTTMCIRYLIRIGFHFVLTRKFSGDSVEYLFSALRQMGGQNDQMSQVACMYALEKTITIGIISGSVNSNVENRECVSESSCIKHRQARKSPEIDMKTEGSTFLDIAAHVLEDPPEIEEISIEVAGASMVAGFLCKLARDSFPCPRASDILLAKSKDSELTEFIRRQDNGGLLFPCDQLIYLVAAAVKLFDEYWCVISQWKHPASALEICFNQPILNSRLITCGCENAAHSYELQKLLVKHLVKILLQNATMMLNESEDKPNCMNKPSSRKILKLS